MKYHEKDDTSPFIISLVFVAVIAVLVIAMPPTKFYALLAVC